MKLDIEPLVAPCEGCDNLGCDLNEEHSMSRCPQYVSYQAQLKGRQEMAKAIRKYISKLNRDAKRRHIGITIGALNVMLGESLKESGVEV